MTRVDYKAENVFVADGAWNKTGDGTPDGYQRACGYKTDKNESQSERGRRNVVQANVTNDLGKVEWNDRIDHSAQTVVWVCAI